MTAPAKAPAARVFSTGQSTSFVGNADFHRCLVGLIDTAESEVIDLVIPETRPDEHDQFILRAYGNAVRRGITCKTLIAPEHLFLVQSTWDPEFDMRTFLQKFTHIRLIERVNGPFTVVDRRKVLLNIQDAAEAGEYTTSVVFEDEALAAHLLATFAKLWDTASGEQDRLIAGFEAARA
ncbi:MAG: TrmB family transcriptional regulator sugar-binding domain-containing protein [bacterium]